MGDIKVILVGVVVGLLCSVLLYGFIIPRMLQWWRKRARTGGEQLHRHELTSTQSGLREPEVDQIEFESADAIASRLEEIWQFDLSDLPTAQEGVVEGADVPDWLARLRDEGVPEESDLREIEWFEGSVEKAAPEGATIGVPAPTLAEAPGWLPEIAPLREVPAELVSPLPALEQEAAPSTPRRAVDFCLQASFRQPEWFIGMSHEFTKSIKSKGIDRKLKGRILEAISYIGNKPTVPKGDTVKPLTGDLKGLWRYRIGDYRLVYRPDIQNRQVVLLTFASRGGIYRRTQDTASA